MSEVLPELSLHPTWRCDENILQPLRETGRWWREVEVSSRSSWPCSRPTLG